MLGKAVLFGVLAVVFYAYLISEPLPPDLAVEFGYTRLKAICKTFFSVAHVAEFFDANVAEVRRTTFELLSPPLLFSDDEIQVYDDVFDDIPVRLYIPKVKGSVLKSGIVYFHGGGWTFGSISDSAGGNLAATVSLGIRDNHPQMKLKLQILINPVLQCADFNLPSYQQNDKLTSFLLSKSSMVDYCLTYALGSYKANIKTTAMNNRLSKSILANRKYKNYLNHSWIPKYLIPTWYEIMSVSEHTDDADLEKRYSDQVKNPYLSPLLSPNLKSLPEAYVMVSEYDVLRDDALLYIKRLREANVTVTEAYDKTVHAGATFGSPAQGALQVGGGATEAYYKMLEFIKSNL